ncbi:MAG: DNA polymerase Y family protein [Planctomycetaceae bacterium]|nr:DNA polymerase Y family protein [Planctomycetaceae bacterium]
MKESTTEKRVLCLQLPNWPIQRLLREQPELRHQPVVLYGKLGRQPRCVWACNELALAQGVRLGMPMVEAKRRFDGFQQAIDQAADLAALEQLAVQCQRFSPYCGVRPANPHRWGLDTLLLDIAKTAKFFGGETSLLQQVRDYFQQQGFYVRGVAAGNWATAWGLAVHVAYAALDQDQVAGDEHSWTIALTPTTEKSLIAALPVAALRVAEDTCQKLRELGIETIAQVQQLPAASLPARFGPELNVRLSEIAGQTSEKIEVCAAATTYHQWRNLEFPTVDLEVLQHHVRNLLEELLPPIAAKQSGVMSLLCQWFSAEAPPLETSLRLVQPVQSIDYLMQLLQLQWERVQLPGEINAVHVLIPAIAVDKPKQQWLFEDSEDTCLRNRSSLLDRLSSRLGADRVVQLRWQAQALPERQFVPRVRCLRQAKPTKTDKPLSAHSLRLLERPTRLYIEPQPLKASVERFLIPDSRFWVPAKFQANGRPQTVQQAVGPERIESQWWEGRWVRRDYYRIHTETSQRFWIYQEIGTGRWWLHGEFA